MLKHNLKRLLAAAVVSALSVVGCTPATEYKPAGELSATPKTGASADAAHDHDHAGHDHDHDAAHDHDHDAEGPHGGAVVPIGNEEYHAEFKLDEPKARIEFT